MLTEHIAVMDLMVLADALLLPQDDLALATVLKSPLFGLDEDELFKLAWNRKGSLRSALRAQRPDLAARLDALREQSRAADAVRVLRRPARRRTADARSFLARLGHEAADALDEFLNLALDYERTRDAVAAGLRGVAALGAGRGEARHGNGARRGAGDDGAWRQGAGGADRHPRRHHDAAAGLSSAEAPAIAGWPARRPPLVWAAAKANDVGPMAAAREAALDEARDEYRRLLYVAMTRAIERLIVCGVDGVNKRPEGCWYDLARGALEGQCVAEAGRRRRRRGAALPQGARRRRGRRSRHGTAGDAHRAPGLAERKSFAATPASAAPIKPSGFVDDPTTAEVPRPREARRRAILRGNIVHRLMQSLPDIPAERAGRGRAPVHRAAEDGFHRRRTRRRSRARCLAVLDDPRFAALFAPGSRAEVPIVGRVGEPQLVTGVVDRLVVAPDAV